MSKIVAANWKMNRLTSERMMMLTELSQAYHNHSNLIVCPPHIELDKVSHYLKDTSIQLGGQDCHSECEGAYTGDVSAEMLQEHGCRYVILGHSERRYYHHEHDNDVCAKAQAAYRAGLKAIICVGESAEERAEGKEKIVVEQQLLRSLPPEANAQNTLLAYEPIWAIGTGKTATLDDIHHMHDHIQTVIAHHRAWSMPAWALYGGSVKANNAVDILQLESVGGVLVGGASLVLSEMRQIINAAE